jgi:hypothetical protein
MQDRKRFLFLCVVGVATLLLEHGLPALAQQPPPTAWVARYSGGSASAVAVDASGNVHVTGSLATIKYDAQGNELWVREGRGRVLALDSAGNVYVTGGAATIKYDSDGNELWARDAGTALAVDGAGNVYVIRGAATVKYDAEGNELWVAGFPGGATALAVDGSGNVYVTGSSAGQYVTVKYDATGDPLWVARYAGTDGRGGSATALALDGAGNVYVTGSMDTGSGCKYSMGTIGYGTIKYDTDGNQLWADQYDGPGEDRPIALALDGAGNVYVTGESRGGLWPPFYYLTVKYDAGGNLLWNRYFGGGMTFARGLAVDASGNVYVTGAHGTDTYSDYATVKYDTDGNPLWVARFGDGGASALAIDAAGNVYVTGSASTSVSPYGIPGDYGYATIKYAAEPLMPAAPSDLVATAVSDSQIELAWTDNSGNEEGFKIERWNEELGEYEEIATVAANVTGFSDTGLAPDTTYSYRVRAFNAAGDSAYTNQAEATTRPE